MANRNESHSYYYKYTYLDKYALLSVLKNDIMQVNTEIYDIFYIEQLYLIEYISINYIWVK